VKTQRHAAILHIIREHRVPSQARLRELLDKAGFHVTQATLSRDIHELGLSKVADPDGHQHYAAPAEEILPAPPLASFLRSLLLRVDGVGPLLVLTTSTGSAGALAAALDHAEWPGILGTVAGDDTLLVIAKSVGARLHLAKRFRDLLESPHRPG
jgi:transcriptional regulator of arginine metabolism